MGTIGNCFDELKTQVGSFLLHTYIKRKQGTLFKSLAECCDGKSVVLQVDFSETATIDSQWEVQSTSWNHAQATLFIAHAWIKVEIRDKEPTEGLVWRFESHKVQQRCVYTDHVPQHWTNQHLQQWLNISVQTEITLFQSQCLGECQQPKHHVELLCHLSQEGADDEWWNWGTVNIVVWGHVKAERAHNTNASEYSTLGKRLCPNIHNMFILKKEIAELTNFWTLNWVKPSLYLEPTRFLCEISWQW